MYFIEETYQTARKEHLCDQCFTEIEQRNFYRRFVYIQRGMGYIALKFHVDPPCPRDALENLEDLCNPKADVIPLGRSAKKDVSRAA
jgi:hypothetical protein